MCELVKTNIFGAGHSEPRRRHSRGCCHLAN